MSLEEHQDLLLVAAKGNLDIYTVPVFAEHVDHLDPTEIQLVVDLSRVRLLDSAGLSALVSLRNRAHRGGARLGLICPWPLARRFWLAGLGAAFAVGDNLAAVRAALAGACDGHGATPALTRSAAGRKGVQMHAPTAAARAARPGSPSRGLLVIQVAILRDAAAQLGRIEGQMAGSRSEARAMHHHRAAVDVLENTIRLLGAQRAALLGHLADVAPASADPQERGRGPAIDSAPRLAAASGA